MRAPNANRAGRVLVVDDDEVQLTIVRAWLESDGYQVVTHNKPEGTSTIVFRERPSIVILDVVMPNLSGDALARLLAATWKEFDVGVVFYTVKDPATLRTLPQQLPVLGAIHKTTDGTEFLRQFKNLVASKVSRGARA